MSAGESITSLSEAVAVYGAFPVPAGPTLSELERMQLRVDEVERAYTFDTAELKRRIAELEAERHVTNEALDDAVQALRADRAVAPAVPSPSFAERAARETDSGRRAAYRMLAEPEPEFHAFLHHENRVGHDLPETGGAS